MRRLCPVCRDPDPVVAITLGTVSGEAGPLKVTVSGMPAAKCVNGHPSAVDNDFMLWLIQELKERAAALPAGEEKGLLLKKYLCSCGAALEGKPAVRPSLALELAYDEGPAFRAELEYPAYRCGACGKEQLRSPKQVRGHVAHVVAALNDAARFPHSA